MTEPLSEVEETAAIIRAGLWALFAAARCASTHHVNATPEDVVADAAQTADALLDAFAGRFPLEMMLSE